ncbi:MFS transporter [Mesobacterium pallidum]|uniref:MFS transporter n=1 Tax=Mesobacterium pallidum TaxID=2872037 RepID=UPI001EE1C947|nr:MFS transporter [Mesobacterium pallidum]
MSAGQFAVTRYYFTLFWVMAAANTYLPIWLENRGMSDAQIGVLNAVPMATVLLLGVFVGRLADAARDWRQAIVIGHFVALFFTLWLGLAEGFVMLLLLLSLAVVPAGLVMPVSDGASIRFGQAQGFSFGPVRAWGTVGYTVMCVVTGYAVLWGGDGIFPLLLVGFAAARALGAWRLPLLRSGTEAGLPRKGLAFSASLRAALSPWVLLPIVAGALLQASHAVMNAFAARYFSDGGVDPGGIGLLIALGAGAEALVMFLFPRLQAWFSARMLILISAAAGLLRWGLLALAPDLAWFWPLQLMHGLTFSLSLLGAIYFIASRTPVEVTAEAQSLFVVMQMATSVLLVAGFGALYGAVGAPAFWAVGAISVLAALLILASFALQRAESA